MNNKITLILPPSEKWLTMINETIRHYARLQNFTQQSEDDLTQSLLEACEAFLLMAHEAGIHDDYEISFNFYNDAITVELVYDGKIPLNPHKTGEYEVPESDADIDKINLDVLWLHLIRRRIDRVYFSVRGSKHAFQMIKYHRELGKERRQWVMGLSPMLRKNLRIEFFKAKDGATPLGCIIQDPHSENVLKLGPSEAFMIQNMNGENTCHDIYMQHVSELGMISPQRITFLYEKLEAAKLLADPNKENASYRFRKIIRKLINPSFSIPYPDEAITLAYRTTQFLFNKIGFLFLVLIGLSGIYPLSIHYDQFINIIANLENFFLAHPEGVFILYFLILVVAFIHEFGHGLMCKHYGGKVNRLGIMFYLGTFIFFCDTSAAWNFPRRSQRFLVSLAGPLTTFAIFGAGLWAAGAFMVSGSIWGPVCICLCLVCFVILILNFNPFIRMDAYYMLMDLTGIPNLRSRSLQFIKKNLFGRFISIRREEEEIPHRVKILFWLYGLIGAIITLIFGIWPFMNVMRILAKESSHQGKIMLCFALIGLLIFRLGFQGYQKFRSIRHRTYKLK